MTILDRYIIRQYLTNILVLFVLLFAVIVLIDFSLNFDEYSRVAERLRTVAGVKPGGLETTATAAYLVWDLWWPRLFLLYNFLLSLVLVGAMGFTCAQLNRHREFVAMMAGGLSLHRAARPIMLVAVLLTGAAAISREAIIPRLAPLLTREKGEAGSRSMGVMRQPLCADSHGRLFYARSVHLDVDEIDGLWVWERDAEGLMTRRITADKAAWEDGHWALTNGRAESRDQRPTTSAAPRREVVEVRTLDTDLTPTTLRLRRFEGYTNNLSTAELSMLLANYRTQPLPPEVLMDKLERVRLGRYAGYACGVLLLAVCLPFFLRREPGNLVLQSIMAAPVAMGGFVAAMIGASAAIPGLPPQVSVFVPVMALAPLAIGAVTSIRT